MTDQYTKQAIITTNQPYDANSHSERLALFEEDGTPIQLDALAVGDMLSTNNLSDVADPTESVMNLNLFGVVTRHTTEIAFDTADLVDGVVIYEPAIGDVLVDVWIDLTEAWDGTTPKAEVGTFDGLTVGLFDYDLGFVSLAFAGTEAAGAGLFLTANATKLSKSSVVPARFTSVNPLKVVVSQDGEIGGADPVATQGAMTVHVFVSRTLDRPVS